jgi:hypothetical protein
LKVAGAVLGVAATSGCKALLALGRLETGTSDDFVQFLGGVDCLLSILLSLA